MGKFKEKPLELIKGDRVKFVAGGKRYLAVVPLMGQVPFTHVPKPPKKREKDYGKKYTAWKEGCKDVIASGKVVIYEVKGKDNYKLIKKPSEKVVVKAGEKIKNKSEYMTNQKLKRIPKLKKI